MLVVFVGNDKDTNRKSAGVGGRVVAIIEKFRSNGYHLKLMGQGPVIGLGRD